MRIIISDSSCLIDLHKGGLLEAIFDLPFTFAIPQPLFDEELLSISPAEKESLLQLGMEVLIVPGEQVLTAQTYFNENRRLKLNDCFALAMAEAIAKAILFTGDQPLRVVAESKNVETHGVLWAIDMLEDHTDIAPATLIETLELYDNDPLVRLPEDEVRKRIRRLKKKL